mmetsp:Transcript_13727/g.34953  ORF Transcript_13727/g.34953 Transcript_13727/m.34953 type:complete len:241 (-) Transcript_13727:155-877(-)
MESSSSSARGHSSCARSTASSRSGRSRRLRACPHRGHRNGGRGGSCVICAAAKKRSRIGWSRRVLRSDARGEAALSDEDYTLRVGGCGLLDGASVPSPNRAACLRHGALVKDVVVGLQRESARLEDKDEAAEDHTNRESGDDGNTPREPNAQGGDDSQRDEHGGALEDKSAGTAQGPPPAGVPPSYVDEVGREVDGVRPCADWAGCPLRECLGPPRRGVDHDLDTPDVHARGEAGAHVGG